MRDYPIPCRHGRCSGEIPDFNEDSLDLVKTQRHWDPPARDEEDDDQGAGDNSGLLSILQDLLNRIFHLPGGH